MSYSSLAFPQSYFKRGRIWLCFMVVRLVRWICTMELPQFSTGSFPEAEPVALQSTSLNDCCHFLLKVEIVSVDLLKYPNIPSFCVMLYWEISFTRCLDLLLNLKKKYFCCPCHLLFTRVYCNQRILVKAEATSKLWVKFNASSSFGAAIACIMNLF